MTEQISKLLKEHLDEMNDNMLAEFKWYLSQVTQTGSRPLQRSQLETSSRTQTVDQLVQAFGGDGAVLAAVDVLYRMKLNDLATKLAQGKSFRRQTMAFSRTAEKHSIYVFPSKNRQRGGGAAGRRSSCEGSEAAARGRGGADGAQGSALLRLLAHLPKAGDAAVWPQLLQELRAEDLGGESPAEMPAVRASQRRS